MSLSYDYYPKVLQVIEAIGNGLTETRACDERQIGIVTFKKYIKNDDNLREQYEEAMQRGFDAIAEALLNPFDTTKTYGESDTQKAALISANMKWFLSKRAARIYGERVEVAHTITADRAITQALERARLRNQGEIIDVTPNTVPLALVEYVTDELVPYLLSDEDYEIMRELGLA
jgi:hypothetical protein